MKKNIAMRVASLVLMCTIVTSCFVSSTFAKYTSSTSGSDSVTVAKWAFTLNNTNMVASQTFTFDLFETIADTYQGTTDDGAVVNERDGAKLIAPGTGGAFDLAIQNNSEVYATIALDFTVTKSDINIPIQFSTDGQTWKTDINELDVSANLAPGASLTGVQKVYWQWTFNGDDSTDTALGIKGTDTVEVKVDVTAEQLDDVPA